jgi:hypothetical protein
MACQNPLEHDMKIELTEHQAKRLANVLAYVMETERDNFDQFMKENQNPENHVYWMAEASLYQILPGKASGK